MTRLEQIVEAKQREVAELREPSRSALLRSDAGKADAPRGFLRALRLRPNAIIAEIKRASPSRGVLTADFEPSAIARAYEMGGADAVSVLTDRHFFQGSPEDLRAARASVACPVLRKDFVISEEQVYEARSIGADAILLIVRILDRRTLRACREVAESLGMDALVEVHTVAEAEQAVDAGARMIGANNRDLDTFDVDLRTSDRLRQAIPGGILAVSESGIRTPSDAQRLFALGYDAILVGEGLIRADDRGEAVRALRPHAGTRPVR
jgi:indole-3-glycerol phosphate synthase